MSDETAREALFDAIEEFGKTLQEAPKPEASWRHNAESLRDLAEAWAWLAAPGRT